MKKLVLLSVFYLLSVFCNAQSGTLDPTFNSSDIGFGNGEGAKLGSVLCHKEQPDGKLLIGGSFKKYNQIAHSGIARLNSDGSLDPDFNPLMPSNGYSSIYSVNSISLEPSGKIIITGAIYLYVNGVSKQYQIIRLNSNGTTDAFNEGNGNGANGIISSTFVQPDGKIIIVGNFTAYNDTPRNHIARLNNDGTLDTSFDPGNGATAGYQSTSIKNISLQSDGKIIIVGEFTVYNGTKRNRIARLNSDGTLDASFDPGTGFDKGATVLYQFNVGQNIVSSITIQPDGKIIVGGKFYGYNGVSTQGLVRINNNGSVDTGFNIGTGFNFKSLVGWTYDLVPGEIETTTLQADGKIIVGGSFTTYNGSPRANIMRLNPDGSEDLTFNVGAGPVMDDFDDYRQKGGINSIVLLSDKKIIIGGNFLSYNNSLCGAIARVNTNGSIDSTFNPGTGANEMIRCSSIQPDDKIIIGGNFTKYNGVESKGVLRLNPDGTVDYNFKFFLWDTSNRIIVNSIGLQSDGKIIIGYSISTHRKEYSYALSRLNSDGSLDTSFIANIQGGEYPIIQPDGKILVKTNFGFYPYPIPLPHPGDQSWYPYIIRLNKNGSEDTSFKHVFCDGNSKNFVLQHDGKIVYCLNQSVKRVNNDGSTDSSFKTATLSVEGLNYGDVLSLNLQSDGKIILGGTFVFVNDVLTYNITRLNSDGTLDESFSLNRTNLTNVYTTKIQTSGEIIIGGENTKNTDIGHGFQHLSRLNNDGSLDSTFNLYGAGPTGTNNDEYKAAAAIYDVNFQSDKTLIIVGSFTAYNGIGRNRITRLLATDELATIDYTISPELKLYPNPVNNFLTIETGQVFEIKNISIFNTLGQLVLAIPDAQKVRTVDVSSLVIGTYFMKINSDKGTFTKKFVKE